MARLCYVFTLSLFVASCAIEPRRSPASGTGSRAEERALLFLAREVPQWSRRNDCFSCHNNGDGARALYVASRAGYAVAQQSLTETTAWLAHPERWDANKGDPGYSDKALARIQFSAALISAFEAQHVRNHSAVESAARQLARDQSPDGSWQAGSGNPVGSPVTYGNHLATVMALETLRRSADDTARAARERAEQWLRQVPLPNVPATAAVLLGLRNATDPIARVRREECRQRLQQIQTDDGGWGPYPDAPPEVFDTALALLALASLEQSVELKATVSRGREFLERAQLDDGSWPETTRPPNGQSYAQQISTTAWATLALMAMRPP